MKTEKMTPPMVRLVKVQASLNAPKNLYNKFAGFNYRNLEGILESVKPLLLDNDLLLIIEDEIINEYVKATATVYDALTGEKVVSSNGVAKHAQMKKGMDDAQITGSASSYARKYCLNGLFLIDDNKDADTNEYKEVQNQPQPQQKKYNNQPQPQNDKKREALIQRLRDIAKSQSEKDFMMKIAKVDSYEDIFTKDANELKRIGVAFKKVFIDV